jgi:hypothetical protein
MRLGTSIYQPIYFFISEPLQAEYKNPALSQRQARNIPQARRGSNKKRR